MLQKIRDKSTGWVAAIFLGAIGVVFVFWGIDFENTANSYAAKVNGEKISVEAVTRAWQQRQSQLQQMMRGELPEAMVKAQQKAIMDEFVRRKLLQQRAEDLGYSVSDETLAKQVVSFPELQVDGKFSRDRYAMLLRQQGLTEPQFEADLRSDLAIRELQSGITDSAFVAPFELQRRYALEKQEREVNYAIIASKDFASKIEVGDAQIQAWYDSHKNDYLSPETVDLQYVELTRTRAESGITVTEEGLKDYYAQVKERFESPERRKARHILITAGEGMDDEAARKKAEELTAQAKAGGDFEALAKANSKDPGSAQQGGDLGWAQRGTMVGPFEDALFSMQKGEIRGPIKTQFGYHIIRLDDIESGGVRSFEEVRPELEAEYRKDRAQTIFYDESQKLADKAFSALTELDSVAKELDLQVKTIPNFTRQGGGELGADPSVIEAAFSEDVLDRGQNSPLVTVGEDRALVLRVANHRPAEPRPLAEVKDQIEAMLRTNGAREAAEKKGAEVLAKLQEGAQWDDLAKQMDLQPTGKRFIGRQDGVAPASVSKEAFSVSGSQISEDKPYYANIATDEGNYAVLAITAVRNADPGKESAEERTARRRGVERQVGNEEFIAYLAELEREADVVRNEKVFQQ